MSAGTTPAVERAELAIHDVECGCYYNGDHTPEVIESENRKARAARAAALDVDELARALYAADPIDVLVGTAEAVTVTWDRLDGGDRAYYLGMAAAVRASVLGGEA